MKHISRERGAVSVLAIVLVLVVVAAAGFAIYNVSRARNNDTQSANSSPSPAGSPDSTASPAADPPSNWTPFSANIGKYSLRYKPVWKTQYCTYSDSDNLQLELAASKLIVCNAGGSTNHVQMQISTQSGNQLSDYDVADAGFTGAKTDVTVGGVAGHRYEGVKEQRTPMDYPPVGTRYIKYVVVANGRTYQFKYYQRPGDADISADFELMVKNTLKFRAERK